jgi:AcrR family transcriptional regulator
VSRPPTKTEARLYDVALTLFATRGYAATSVREIIEQVGLTKPVLYYYCRDKLDLFEKLIERTHREAFQGLDKLVSSEGDPLAQLRAILHGTFEFCRADWRVPRLMFGVSHGPVIPEITRIVEVYTDRRYSLIRQLVGEGVNRRILAPHDLDVLTISFCSLMDHPVTVMSRNEKDVLRLTPELADSLFSVFLDGGKARA